MSKPASFCEIDYYNNSFSYPSFFTVEISSSGRLNGIVWIQELWYREILIFSNESLSYIINAREVEPGETVTVVIDDEWRTSNI